MFSGERFNTYLHPTTIKGFFSDSFLFSLYVKQRDFSFI